jgi:hypothetical protein
MAKMPMNPKAGVPGPGPFSVRDDQLRMGSTSYGEGVETEAIMGGAKMATTPDVRPIPGSEVRRAAQAGTRLFDDSARPEEDIMRGSPIGPQEGPEILGMNTLRQGDNDIIAKYMPALDAMAALPDTPQSFRVFVRSIQGKL